MACADEAEARVVDSILKLVLLTLMQRTDASGEMEKEDDNEGEKNPLT